MDNSEIYPYRASNKYLNQQIKKKFKNRHKNTKKSQNKKIQKNRKKIKHKKISYQQKRRNKSSQQRWNVFKYKSSNIFELDDYIKPNPNREGPHIIKHNDYYDLEQLISSNKQSSATQTIRNETKTHQLYDEEYLLSNNECKWIKLQRGKYFNSSFYIFNRDEDIHSVEIIKREENQNINVITYFLQNVIEELYENVVLSDDLAFVIGEYCRGYLIGHCYNRECNKYINFFYEDRYIGVNTYFYISYNFEINDIIYCHECFMNDKICKTMKCECGEYDFHHQFNKYLCYNYEDNKDEIIIDEFKCKCIGHKLRCSRHPKCNKCQLTICNECEYFGWGLNKNGLCLKCDITDSIYIECNGCKHIFDGDKLNKCTLCNNHFCDGIKWRYLKDDNKDRIRIKYDKYLEEYKCHCNWKEKYFDAAHNLWYPLYSEWQRRLELLSTCYIEEELQCIHCNKLYVVCNGCSELIHDKFIICDECTVHNKHQCDLCDIIYINCNVKKDSIILYGEQDLSLNNMIKKQCIECNDEYFICNGCYDKYNGERYNLYLCNKCKMKQKKYCIYCEEMYFHHISWNKILRKKDVEKFRYFMENIYCKQCNFEIKNQCNNCYNDGVCIKCNGNIKNYNNGYESLCQSCYDEHCCLLKTGNNCFLSNIIDKKWKNNHYKNKKRKNKMKKNRKRHRKTRLNKEGKFIYNIKYDFDAIKISSTWRRYKKTNRKTR